MAATKRFLDTASLATIVVTFILFVLAIIVKGWSHDLLLEAAVFLVSVKLIVMSYKNSMASAKLDERLQRMEQLLVERQNQTPV